MTPSIVRKEINDTHYYFVNDEFVPSVSNILDVAGPKEYGLINFFKTNSPEEIEEKSSTAKQKGTLVHDLIERLLNGLEIPLKDYPDAVKKLVAIFNDWYNLYLPTDYSTETVVACMDDNFKYAGTLDLICTLDGKKTLIDFKTNKSAIYFSNKLQVMAYKYAYEQTTGEKIEQCYVLRIGSQHKAGYEFKLIDDVTVDSFKAVYKVYLDMNGGKLPTPPVIDTYPDTLKLETISLRNAN